MSTSVSIGRITGSTDQKVQTLSRSGRGLRLGGLWTKFGAMADSEWRAEQVAALIDNPDEPVIPLVWGGSSGAAVPVTGYYRVTGVQADGTSGLAGVGVHGYSVDLERVPGYAAPLFEAIVRGARREGSHASLTPQATFGLPSTVGGFEIGANLTPTSTMRQCEGGFVSIVTDPGNTLFNANPSFFVPAASWYTGAATLSIGGRVAVGRQVPNAPQGWQISNGIVRLSGAVDGILVESWNGSLWSLPRTLQPGVNSGPSASLGDLWAPHALTVLRNSPEEVAIRLTYDLASRVTSGRFSATLDISLRRGARVAAFDLRSRGTYQYQVDVGGWGSLSGTALSGGVTYSGALYVGDTGFTTMTGASGKPSTTRRVTGGVGTSRMRWGFGYASGTGIDTPQAVANQWAAVQVERVLAVAR